MPASRIRMPEAESDSSYPPGLWQAAVLTQVLSSCHPTWEIPAEARAPVCQLWVAQTFGE